MRVTYFVRGSLTAFQHLAGHKSVSLTFRPLLLLLNCLHADQLQNQTLLSHCLALCCGTEASFQRSLMDVFFFFLHVYGRVCLFMQVQKEKSTREGETERDVELSEREWESWNQTLTWSFLMVHKRPVSLEALLRLQRNAFLVFALEELTDHRPVCSLSKDSCLCSFLIRTETLCD